MRFLRASLCVLVLGSVGASPVFAAASWLKLQTEDVVIYSDASPKDVVEFGVGYAAFRSAFRTLFAPPVSPPPVKIILFRRLSDLQRRVPPSTIQNAETTSYSAEIDGDALFAVAVDGDRHAALERTYEFDTIWGLGRCGYFLPIWMSQGAGEVLSSITVRKTACEVGDGPSGHQERWEHGTELPWNRFFEINTSSPEYAGLVDRGKFHAQCWALMHRIMLESDNAPALFNKLAMQLRDHDALAAVENALGVPADHFDLEIRRHLYSKRATRELAFDAATLRAQLKPVAAPDAEVHVVLADLLYSTGKVDDSDAELARAQVLAPNSVAVKEAKARRALQDRQFDDAAQLYRDAIAAGSTSPAAYLHSAELRMNEFSTGNTDRAGDGGPKIEQTLAEVRKALTLHPGSMEGYHLLGRALYLYPQLTPAHIDELSRGVTRGTAGEAVRYYRALLYERLGRKDDFLADLRTIVADSEAAPQLRDAATRALAADELDRTAHEVDRLVTERRFAEARELVKKGLAGDINRQMAATYEQMGDFIDEVEGLNGLEILQQTKKWPELVAAGTAFLEKHADSPNAERVKWLVDQARAAAAPAPATK